MKKNVILLIFLGALGSRSWAGTELQVSGEADIIASMWNLPTGERGNSAFAIPSLLLNLEAPLKDDNLLFLQLEGSEEQLTTGERFTVKLRQAHLDLVSVFQGMKALRLGLIPQVWQEAQYQIYGYRFLGREAWAMTEKWGYLSPSDLGVSFMQELPAHWGEWALTLSNGEGVREKENGPHKEAAVFFRFHRGTPWSLSLNYIRGMYDRYGEDVGVKERAQAMILYRQEKWRAGVELLTTQDPADAITQFAMAEAVSVIDLAGEIVRGHAASVFSTFSTGPRAEVLLRYDYLNAASGHEGRDLQMGMVALSYLVSVDIRAAIMTDYTRYGENFGPGARDRSKVALATQVLF